MKTLLFFIAAQLAGNGITLLIAASLAHLLRRRLASARLDPPRYSYAGTPC